MRNRAKNIAHQRSLSTLPTIGRGEAGFSLVELMIVSVILTMAGYGTMRIMQTMFVSESEVKMTVSASELTQNLRNSLELKENCELNFKGDILTATPSTVTEVRAWGRDPSTGALTTHAPLYNTNEVFDNRSIRLDEMTFGPFVPVEGTNGTADLVLRFSKLKAVHGFQELTRRITVNVTLTDVATGEIESCHVGGTGGIGSDAEACEEFGGRLVVGATPADNRCIFSQIIATLDPAYTVDPATPMLLARADANSDGTYEDLFAVLPDGRAIVNYRLGATGSQLALPPADANTKLYVGGDARVSNNVFSNVIRARQLIIAPTSEWTDPVLTDTSKALSPPNGSGHPQMLMKEPASATYAGLGALNGTLYTDGGGDAHSTIANTSLDPTGGIEFNWNRDGTASPYPATTTTNKVVSLALRNSGEVGIGGYTLKGANPLPLGVGPAVRTAPNGWTYSDVRLFVREGMVIETDLYVTGNRSEGAGTQGKLTATAAIPTPSDRRWKFEIQPIMDAVSKVLSIEGVRYRWKKESSWGDRDKKDIGFIAQQVREHFPKAVVTDAAGYLHLNYEKLIPVLWQAFREMLQETKRLEVETQELERIFCRDRPQADFCHELKVEAK